MIFSLKSEVLKTKKEGKLSTKMGRNVSKKSL